MKIVTYNIWNNDLNFEKRIDLLINTLKNENIDILALQEVKDFNLVKKIKNELNFKYYYFKDYCETNEGLAILSKYEIMSYFTNWENKKDNNSYSLNVIINYNDLKLSITNIHLDYMSSYNRELEIVNIVKEIEKQNVDYYLLLGDFNTYPNSIIHSYLLGLQSLIKHSTNWIDLAESFSDRTGKIIEVTLDFKNNPRWDNEYTLEVPGRFDWILLKNPYPKKYPKLIDFSVIGKDRVNNITPSDHYGVLYELEFDKNFDKR